MRSFVFHVALVVALAVANQATQAAARLLPRAEPERRCTAGWQLLPPSATPDLEFATLEEFLISPEANGTWPECSGEDILVASKGCYQETTSTTNYKLWPRFSCPLDDRKLEYVTVGLRAELSRQLNPNSTAGPPIVLDLDLRAVWRERRIRGPDPNDGNFFPGVALQDVVEEPPPPPRAGSALAPSPS